MIQLSLDEIAEAVGGRVHPVSASSTVIEGAVVTDSREVVAGGLYVARVGDHADGHTFVGAAARAGAVAALTSREMPELACVVVPEVGAGFAALGRLVVDRCRAQNGLKIVGITGSSGKTSTKDLLAQVLTRQGRTVAAQASYNSEVGVPLTVCRLVVDSEYLVAEMGASGVGHIDFLTRIAPPDIAVVLNVGSAHLSEFGSREAIAHTKAELVRALTPGGLAVLNADDPIVAAMASDSAAPVMLFGSGPDAQVQAGEVQLNHRGQASFTLMLPGQEPVGVRLGLYGEHHVGNALAVAAVAHCWGMAPGDIADALSEAVPVSRWRMEVTDRPDGVTIVNDAYNANPESMRAALRALAAMCHQRRAIAVIGEMRELGADSVVEHQRVGIAAAELGIDEVVSVGTGAAPAARAFKTETGTGGVQVDEIDAAPQILEDMLTHGDVVLLKSSRDAGLRHLGDQLAAPRATP